MTTTVNLNTIKIGHFDGASVPENLMTQYGHLRWQCFDPADPYVNMDNEHQLEFDHFDWQPHVRYIFISTSYEGQPDQLVCGMRLIPTVHAYDLELKSWDYLTSGCDLPKDRQIIETGRWVGMSRKSQYGELYTGLMNREIYKWCLANGFNRILGVIYTRFESLFLQQGVDLQRCSLPYDLDGNNAILMMQIKLDSNYFAFANRQIVNGLIDTNITEVGIRMPEAA